MRRSTWVIGVAAAVYAVGGANLIACSASERQQDQIQAVAQLREAVDVDSNKSSPQALPASLRSLLGPEHTWVNASELQAEDLRGKVVLVNFWTYSCINSLRTLPYLRAWAARYQDRGLVVIGVHTPEFAFEHDLAKVQRAVTNLPVGYPVVLDNDYEIWRAFDNNAWPGFYFVDATGRLRHRMLGEGSYGDAERLIQKMLSEASGLAVTDPVVDIASEGAQAPPDWEHLRSPETYIGYGQATNFASAGGVKRDATKAYASQTKPSLNHWSLSGDWKIGREFGEVESAGGRINFRFHARDLHLVLGRNGQGASIRFRVTIDDEPPRANHGADVDAEGWGSLDQDRMYQLVRQSGAVADRTFEIEFSAPGARAYSFTFG